MKSIRHRLLLALLAAMAAALAVGAWATYEVEFQQADALLDHHLRQIALAVREQGFQSSPAPVLPSDGGAFDYSVQVWNAQGVTIYATYPPHVFPFPAHLGFATAQTSDGPWRVFAMSSQGEIIQAAQPMGQRDRQAADAAWQSVRPLLLLFPLMAVLIWVLVGRGLAPIARLARAIAGRSASALEPIDAQVPSEIEPLVKALNGLLVRLGTALKSQRQFVADAAHGLRTPLTALQLQAQLLERASSEPERAAALGELQLGLERLRHVVQQLLTLARTEPEAAPSSLGPVRLDRLIDSVVAEQRGMIELKRMVLQLDRPEVPVAVLGEEQALRTLLANVLDNAVRYTPAGGRVLIAVACAGDSVSVRIEDAGPGIPTEERSRVFDRFYRGEGTEEPGTGLGLAIVKSIAERYGLILVLSDSAAGGLAVNIEFRRAPDAPPASTEALSDS
jgi:two-component system, OmpR family, sensor kinase